jgi:hypothetical protein
MPETGALLASPEKLAMKRNTPGGAPVVSSGPVVAVEVPVTGSKVNAAAGVTKMGALPQVASSGPNTENVTVPDGIFPVTVAVSVTNGWPALTEVGATCVVIVVLPPSATTALGEDELRAGL